MTVMQQVAFKYEIGEEVLFDLPPAGTAGDMAQDWTIGEIVERTIANGRPTYALRFREGDGNRTIRVGESAIEGTA